MALPAIYFYSGDNNTSRLEEAETGKIDPPHLRASNSSNTSADIKQ
jgi:hypothetical protein